MPAFTKQQSALAKGAVVVVGKVAETLKGKP